MKKTTLIFACISMLAFSCKEEKSDSIVKEDQVPTLPMELTYPGKPVIGSWDNVKTVMEWNKRLSQLNIDELHDLLADSLRVMLADGMEFDVPRDSAISILKVFASEVTSIKVVYTAVVPVNNTDKNDEWVLSWTDETITMKDGKVDHHYIHENYLMRGGKIREVIQYARKDPAEVK